MTTITLSTGQTMPSLGFGVFAMDDAATAEAVGTALEVGYRMIDTAAAYGNESGVGAGVRSSGVPRDEIFVTTKLWSTDHADPATGLSRSLDALGLDRVDLYLIHWPDEAQGRFVDAWESMQDLQARGLATSLGVSNFTPSHLDALAARALPQPAVNQIEVHPLLPAETAVDLHRTAGIVTQAWSPFARGKAFGLPGLSAIAERHGRSESQVILRWHLQRGLVALPKSSSERRMRENFAIWDFELGDDEMAQISSLGSGERVDETYYARFA